MAALKKSVLNNHLLQDVEDRFAEIGRAVSLDGDGNTFAGGACRDVVQGRSGDDLTSSEKARVKRRLGKVLEGRR